MWPPLIKWVTVAAAFVVGSFILWRQMRQDYDQEEILTLTLLLAGVAAGGAKVGQAWGAVVGLLVTLGAWCRWRRWNFWEWLDVTGPLALAFGLLASLPEVVPAALLATGLGLVVWLKRRYRQFAWYVSGKPGFVGISCALWWAVAQLGVAFWQPAGIYWAGLTGQQWLASWWLTVWAGILYWRSGRSLIQDLEFLWRPWHPAKPD